MIKRWAQEDLDNALKYYQSIGWCPVTGRYLDDMKALIPAMKSVDANITKVLDGFMKDRHLRTFLVIHSVFNIDARSNGDFIETYMANRIQVSNDQVERMFSKKLPEGIAELLAPFEVEPIVFEAKPYRVEFGCRKDPETGRYPHDPIRVIDTTLDCENVKVFDSENFIEQYEDIAL